MNHIARLERLPLSRPHRRLLVIGGLGYTFDAADAAVIAFILPVVAKQWALSPGQVSLLASALLVGYLFGALGAGVLGDRFGRKKVMIGPVHRMRRSTLPLHDRYLRSSLHLHPGGVPDRDQNHGPRGRLGVRPDWRDHRPLCVHSGSNARIRCRFRPHRIGPCGWRTHRARARAPHPGAHARGDLASGSTGVGDTRT